jgi:hypothetical protein
MEHATRLYQTLYHVYNTVIINIFLIENIIKQISTTYDFKNCKDNRRYSLLGNFVIELWGRLASFCQ